MCDSSSIDVYAKSLGCFWETTLNNFPKLVSLIYPILFAKLKNVEKAIFGLPGNPISSSACFRFFVFPYLLNILGTDIEKPLKAKLINKSNRGSIAQVIT